MARWLAPLLACAALGLPGTPVRAADPPASDPAASGAAAPTVRIVEHPDPYLRRRAAWLSDELRSLDDGTKAWLAWENATGDWGGLRPTLQERGILLGLDYIAELFSNLHGGATTHDATHAAGLASLSLSLDTKRLGLWPDGTVVFSVEHQDGRGVSREVGSLSDIGPLAAVSGSVTHLAAWYVQQNFDGDRLVARLGKSDANDGFVDSELTGRYLNGDFDPPANIPMPTYPTPAFGLAVFADPAEWLTVAAAAYGADLGIHEGGGAGLFDGRVFSIAELTLHAGPLGLPGHYSAGAWLRTVETPDPRDPTGTASSPRNYGAYAVFDQRLFAPDAAHPERGLGAWFQLSWTPSDRNRNDLWVGGGLVYTGLVPGRPSDDLGFGASSAELTVSPSGRRDPPPEIVLEWFYAIALARWLTLQPDLQVVLNPMTSGRDAVVVGARLSIDL